ncbi:MAG TPA: PAS domain-containing protein, partial [candidate division Zixibacteria bacterium]|nr:PAS domain-containing protein [candidate division Zixibacteria bacterium]
EAQRVGNIGFWDWDIANGNLYWSDEIYRIFGLSRQSFGATYEAFLNSVHPEDREFVTGAVDAAVYDNRDYRIDHRIVLPSGGVRHVHEQGEVYRDGRGVPVRMIGIVQDITDSVQAREQLAETRDRLELALEGGDLGVWEWHPQTGRTLYDARWASILKYDLAEVGTDESFWRSHVHPDDIAHVLERWSGYLAGEGTAYQARYRMRAKSGEWVWVLDRGKAVERDETGRPLRVTGTHQDVTAQVQAENALRESEVRFRELAEMLPEVVYEADATGRLTYLNQRGYDMTGLTPADLERGVDPSQLVRSDERERVRANMGRVMRRESVGPNEYHVIGKDGVEFPVIVRSTAHIVDGTVVGLRGLVIDLSDQKIREAEQTRAQKLESVGALAGGIAHDFNNILTAVIGGLNLAKMGLDGIPEAPADVREDLDTAERAAMQAQGLTQQLLTFARGGAPALKTDTLPELIEETAGFALRGSNVRQTIDITPDLSAVEIDRGQISQVINNLVINAKQAMPDGGGITIRAENMRIDEGSTLALPPGAYVRIVVADEGTGIPGDILPKIFDPYFTTKQTGSGLGLATSYSIIKNHRGLLTVASEPGVGATFNIYLPASERTPLRGGGGASPGHDRSGRVLVMDDEESIRTVAQRGLGKLGLDVVVAASGEDAIAEFTRARARGKPFDILVMDLTVPGAMGGAEALQRIREIDPSVRAIVSSGYSSDPVMANYERYGFCDLVSKPFHVQELAEAVSRALAESALRTDD